MLAIVWRAFLVLPCPEDMGGLPPPSRGCLGRLLLGVGLVHWKNPELPPAPLGHWQLHFGADRLLPAPQGHWQRPWGTYQLHFGAASAPGTLVGLYVKSSYKRSTTLVPAEHYTGTSAARFTCFVVFVCVRFAYMST